MEILSDRNCSSHVSHSFLLGILATNKNAQVVCIFLTFTTVLCVHFSLFCKISEFYCEREAKKNISKADKQRTCYFVFVMMPMCMNELRRQTKLWKNIMLLFYPDSLTFVNTNETSSMSSTHTYVHKLMYIQELYVCTSLTNPYVKQIIL